MIPKSIYIFIVLGIVAMFLMPTTMSLFDNFSTDTEEVTKETSYVKIKGHVEFMDMADHSYSTGWKADGGYVKSEQIAWKAWFSIYMTSQAWFGEGISGYYSITEVLEYKYLVKVNGNLVATYPTSGYYKIFENNNIEINDNVWTQFNLDSQSYYVSGSEFGTIEVFLECAFKLYHRNSLFQWEEDYSTDFTTMSKDGAYLKSGVGIVRLGGDLPDVIEEGTEVKFYLKTGYTHGRGWDCFIDPPGDKAKVEFAEDGFTGQDGFEAYVTFKIPIGWFTLSGDNEVRIELFNALWMESVTTFFVIDMANLAPKITSMIWNTDYNAGSSVVVNIQAEMNAETQSPISYFRVYVYFGVAGSMPGTDFPTEYIINGVDYPATDGHCQVMFNIPDNRGDTLSIKANAIDEYGRASLGEWLTMDVINPNDPSDGGGEIDSDPDYPFVLDMVTFAIIVMVVIMCILAYMYAPVPPQFKALIAMIILIIGLVIAFLSGTGGI